MNTRAHSGLDLGGRAGEFEKQTPQITKKNKEKRKRLGSRTGGPDRSSSFVYDGPGSKGEEPRIRTFGESKARDSRYPNPKGVAQDPQQK